MLHMLLNALWPVYNLHYGYSRVKSIISNVMLFNITIIYLKGTHYIAIEAKRNIRMLRIPEAYNYNQFTHMLKYDR